MASTPMATSTESSAVSFGSTTPFAEPQWYRAIPSPYYTESHQSLRGAARAFFDEHTFDVAYEWEENRAINPDVYQAFAKAGLLAAFAFGPRVPLRWAQADGTVFGGVKAQDWDGFHDMIMIDELHRCASVGVGQATVGSLQIGCPPIYNYGSQELQDRVLPDIFSGRKRLCLAITEPQAGSDVKNLSTSAKLNSAGTHYIVNGTKKWITCGMYSDYFTTAVRTSGKPGDPAGISFLLIENGPGVTRNKMLMSGQWAAGTTLLNFEDVEVPKENLIGREGEGFKMILTNFNHERLLIGISAQRLARCCLEDTINYAHKRRVFGKALIESEVIRNKLAHMARCIESQQTWLESIVYAIHKLSHEEANRRLGGTTALMKAHCSMTLELVAREAVQILGGIGITRGGQGERVERIRRDAKSVAIPGGSEEILLDFGVRQEIRQAATQGFKL